MKRKISGRFTGILAAVCLLLAGCGNIEPGQVKKVDTAMGTVIQQNLYVLGEKDYCGEILTLLEELEWRELSWRLDTSQVYGINHATGEEGIPVTAKMADILGRCLELYQRSTGAFDVTMGTVVRLWDIDRYAAEEEEGFRIPGKQELEAALSRCGSDKLRLVWLEPEEGGIKGMAAKLYRPAGMQLDLGAVGKGIALTRIKEYLRGEPDITGAVISVGGSILTYGGKPDGSSFRVGIRDPADPSRNIGVLVLEGDWCISTSGDYERYVEEEGVRYHHLLDPSTGCPARSGVRSVTVLAEDGFLSDGLSTACFILGAEKGMELAAMYGAEVLFVLDGGEIQMSPGMKACFQED